MKYMPSRLLMAAIRAAALAAMGLILWQGFSLLSDPVVPKPMLLLLPLLVLPAVCLLLPQRRNGLFAVLLFAVSFAARALLAATLDTQPVSDFSVFHSAALKLVSGDLSYAADPYFQNWRYQHGIVLYYAMQIRVFGDCLLAMKLINCLWLAGTNTLLYLMGRTLFGERPARLAAAWYLVWPGTFMLCSVLTNQHVSSFFLLLGLYAAIKCLTPAETGLRHPATFHARPQNIPGLRRLPPAARRKLLACGSGLSLAVGNLFRPQGIIVIAGLVLLVLIRLLPSAEPDRASRCRPGTEPVRLPGPSGLLLCLLPLVAAYLLAGGIFSGLFRLSGISPDGLGNRFPLWKFVVGLNHETTGQYSQEDIKNIYKIPDIAARDEAALAAIRERLLPPSRLLSLFVEKSELMWAKKDNMQWGFSHLANATFQVGPLSFSFKSVAGRVLFLERAVALLAFLLAFAAQAVCLFARHREPTARLLPILLFALYYGMHLLIEVQPRYRDFGMFFVFLASMEMLSMLPWFRSKPAMPESDDAGNKPLVAGSANDARMILTSSNDPKV